MTAPKPLVFGMVGLPCPSRVPSSAQRHDHVVDLQATQRVMEPLDHTGGNTVQGSVALNRM